MLSKKQRIEQLEREIKYLRADLNKVLLELTGIASRLKPTVIQGKAGGCKC